MEFRNGQVAVTGASGGIGQGPLRSPGGARPVSVRSRPCGARATNWCQVCGCRCHGPIERRSRGVVGLRDGVGPVDLVCCAGIVEDDVAAEDMPIELFDAVLGVNLRGLFLSCQAFGRELLARGGGSIVNIASMSGNYVVNFPQHQCAYNASKAAVTALSKSLAVEWGPRGVRVNAVSPGYVGTPLLAKKAHQFDQWMQGIVLNRFAEPDEVARAVAFLLSTDSGYCCGTELLMDGGFSLR